MAKYKINKGFIVQKIGAKTIIFDGEESIFYTFNETASFIFQKLKQGWDKKKILQEMSKKYLTDVKKISSDLEELFFQLKKYKIITSHYARNISRNSRLSL